jgi:galactonate dehydratase
MNRRELLQSAGAMAAGAAFVAEAVPARANPAAQVEDAGSAIRLAGLRTFRAGAAVFLRLQTNRGVVGWGEVKGVDPRVARPLAEALYDLLDGENPTRIEHLWQKVYRAHRDIRGGPFLVHALAGLDMALWDIAGKLWGVPVYRLLGGPCRDRIRVYHTKKALKVPPPGRFELASAPADIARVVAAVKEARDRVGPDGAVMFDAHSALPPATMIQLADALKSYDLLFIEEPAVPGTIEVFQRIKQAVSTPWPPASATGRSGACSPT